MNERLTWKQIQEKYPDQWVGLTDVSYIENDGISINTAVVKYDSMSRDGLTNRMLDGEIIARYTAPDNCFQLGTVGIFK